ncbi:polyketide cyclase [Nakamurella silvestris]|nr:polyketide cyclase [Nakamurella silvestris]
MATTVTRRHIRAPRDQVYAALLDPAAITRWRVPEGMDAQVHEFDPRIGGRFRISLTYDAPDQVGKTSGRTDTYHGQFLDLVPGRQVVEQTEFETSDPALQGIMTMTTTLIDSGDGTDIVIRHDGLPHGISAQDNELGTRMALDHLAVLLEQDERRPRQ